MADSSSIDELVSLLQQRIGQKSDIIRRTLQDALSRIDSELGSGALLTREEIEPYLAPPPAAGGTGDLTGLKRWVAAIDEDRNQVNILKLLIQAAREHAARVSLFVVRDDKAQGWAASGFTGNGTATDERVKTAVISLTADTLLKEVAASGQPYVGPAGRHPQNEILFEAIGSVEPTQIAAYPLVNKGRVAALLYADSGTAPFGIASPDAIEILTRAATMSIELIPMRGKSAAAAAGPAPAPAAAAGATAQPAAPRPAPSVPVAAPAARPITAATPAPAPASAPAAARLSSGPDLSRLPPDEVKLHEAAKRLARVLVAEIKLYFPQKVDEGRKHRDLYARLKDEIDRSKSAYYQKVNPKIAQTTNYFYDELVNALAEGDTNLLSGYA